MAYDISFTDILTRGTFGFFSFAVLIALILLAVLWLVLPFVVFKVKSLLQDTNTILFQIDNHLMGMQTVLREQTGLLKSMEQRFDKDTATNHVTEQDNAKARITPPQAEHVKREDMISPDNISS